MPEEQQDDQSPKQPEDTQTVDPNIEDLDVPEEHGNAVRGGAARKNASIIIY